MFLTFRFLTFSLGGKQATAVQAHHWLSLFLACQKVKTRRRAFALKNKCLKKRKVEGLKIRTLLTGKDRVGINQVPVVDEALVSAYNFLLLFISFQKRSGKIQKKMLPESLSEIFSRTVSYKYYPFFFSNLPFTHLPKAVCHLDICQKKGLPDFYFFT